MDVVLELADTYMFDRLYANLLPIQSAFTALDPISTLTAGFKSLDNSTSFNDASQAAAAVAQSSWQFEPASQYFSVQPSEYAWMSRWDRDNLWRQFISFYIITW